MVVSGYSKEDPSAPNGYLHDVELLSAKKSNKCTKRVAPTRFAARAFLWDNGTVEYEAAKYGMTGLVSKDSILVCGGKNRIGNKEACYEYDHAANTWREGAEMRERRFRAVSVLSEEGNMLTLGGVGSNSKLPLGPESSEVYDPRTRKWRYGKPLPPYHRDSGITNHCVARINSTHLVLTGGYAETYTLGDPENNRAVSILGSMQKKTWLFDGFYWRRLADMDDTREGHACAVVELRGGELGLLVAGGCSKSFCLDDSALASAQVLTINDATSSDSAWRYVADLPKVLVNGKMETFDGLPTIFGGIMPEENAEGGGEVNGDLIQYDGIEDRWKVHERRLRVPRSSAAVFEVPYYMFSDC